MLHKTGRFTWGFKIGRFTWGFKTGRFTWGFKTGRFTWGLKIGRLVSKEFHTSHNSLFTCDVILQYSFVVPLHYPDFS